MTKHGLATAFVLTCFLGGALVHGIAYAQADNRGPRGQQQLTQLPNGLTATTSVVAGDRGVTVDTVVEIPVPAVFETRSDATTGAQRNAGGTTKPAITRASDVLPVRIPGNKDSTPPAQCCGNW